MYHPGAIFQYLKSFRRARVTFESPLDAVQARIQLHETEILGKIVKVYFSQVYIHVFLKISRFIELHDYHDYRPIVSKHH